MSLLRRFLRVKPVNRGARWMGRAVLSAKARAVWEHKLPLVDPFTVTLPNGVPIHFQPYGDICSKRLKFGGWNGYERSSIELFYALAQHAQVTFDAGAYLGYFGLVAAGARPGAKVYAFEAVPQLAEIASRLASLNKHLALTVIPAAVAASPGKISLYLPDDPFSSDTSTNPGHRPNRAPVEVPAVSLDEFVRENGIDRVDLLKIDTETTEPAVLAGFAETISRDTPTFICEVLPSADVAALEQFRQRHDYQIARIGESGLIAADQIIAEYSGPEMNYLFYPRNGNGPIAEEVQRRLALQR
jgi:FkbM family methyltransferase